MAYLLLHGDNPARRMRRLMRDAFGKETGRVYEFAPGVPLFVEDGDLSDHGIAKDIRNGVLTTVVIDELRKATPIAAPLAAKTPATKTNTKSAAAK